MKNEIPAWVIEYNNAGHLSSAGRAVKITLSKVDALEKELASLKQEYNALVDKFTLAQEIGIHMQEAYNLMIYNGAQVPASVCSKVNHLRTQAQIKTKQLNELNKPFSDNS